MATKIPASWMRGGSSKGVFFLDGDLPQNLMARESLLLRILGTHSSGLAQNDGIGGASSNASQVAIIKKSARTDCDVDYIFGAVPIYLTDQTMRIDWTRNCTNLTAAVASFAVSQGLAPATVGDTKVRIWQVNLGKRIDAYLPADLHADAQIRLEFLDPVDGYLLPTGSPKDWLAVPGLGRIEASFINMDRPIVFVRADPLGMHGREFLSKQKTLSKQPNKLARKKNQVDHLRAVCTHAAVAMGLAHDIREAAANPALLPVLCWLDKPAAYKTVAYGPLTGDDVPADAIDILAHHFSPAAEQTEFDGSISMGLGLAAAIPGTVANEMARTLPGIATRIGHALGILTVGAEVSQDGNLWRVEKIMITRSARCLMSGWAHLP